jgi:hypothetical protein
MNLYPRRGWSPDTPCSEYAKFQRIAEELVANIGETASPEQCEQVQKSLLFVFQELQQGVDPLHLRFPGGHRCLEHAYLEYAMRLTNRAVLSKPLPGDAPAPPPKPRSLRDVAQDFLPEKDNGE